MIEDDIFWILMEADRPLRSGEIAERLGVTRQTIVNHLNKLKDAGKVEPVLCQNVSCWQLSRKWDDVPQRAKRLEQRLKEMYGERPFSPPETRERLKGEFKPEEFDALLGLIPHLKPPEIELKETRRIGSTPEEERLAETRSRYSRLAAEIFNRVEVLLETLNVPPEALDWLPALPPNPPLPRLLFDRKS